MEPLLAVIVGELDVDLTRIERCLERLPEESVWKRPRDGMNAVGNLCLHLAGNESHYVGHGIGRAEYVRDRPGEFRATGGFSSAQLVEKLREARQLTRETFGKLSAADLDRPVEIDHPGDPTVLRLVLHVFEHYAYHTGQIVLLTRWLQASDERVLEWGH
ncbi:MAG: DUF664 domain-containing protein [Planctomycetota bacterium]|nr:DUF664 domain-containing protein [Planctomycetota bacterium]